ncbi:BrnT family toxin [Sulfuriferula nivalis]|uniref:BrnT family toxin n=1 Tax=Sulfuriferula nivalis TaxID=2675298 RepID=UPI0033653F19
MRRLRLLGNILSNNKHRIERLRRSRLHPRPEGRGFTRRLIKHSQGESRFHALGKTDEGRTLHITFTLRNASEKIRVISARDMHKKERMIYEQAT